MTREGNAQRHDAPGESAARLSTSVSGHHTAPSPHPRPVALWSVHVQRSAAERDDLPTVHAQAAQHPPLRTPPPRTPASAPRCSRRHSTPSPSPHPRSLPPRRLEAGLATGLRSAALLRRWRRGGWWLGERRGGIRSLVVRCLGWRGEGVWGLLERARVRGAWWWGSRGLRGGRGAGLRVFVMGTGRKRGEAGCRMRRGGCCGSGGCALVCGVCDPVGEGRVYGRRRALELTALRVAWRETW